jgi:hypothetical protein
MLITNLLLSVRLRSGVGNDGPTPNTIGALAEWLLGDARQPQSSTQMAAA